MLRSPGYLRVDPDHAGVETRREATTACAIAGPDVGGKSVVRIVRDAPCTFLVRERYGGKHRTEHLLLRDTHVVHSAHAHGLPATGHVPLRMTEAGKVANLVLLSGDPLADIRNTRRIEAVILRGRVLDRSELDAMLRALEVTGR